MTDEMLRFLAFMGGVLVVMGLLLVWLLHLTRPRGPAKCNHPWITTFIGRDDDGHTRELVAHHRCVLNKGHVGRHRSILGKEVN